MIYIGQMLTPQATPFPTLLGFYHASCLCPTMNVVQFLLSVLQVGTIVTVEHSPVYTLGRREKEDAALTGSLKRIGAAVIKV